MSTACGRPQRGRGSGSCGRMWTGGGESKTRFFVDVIIGWPLTSEALAVKSVEGLQKSAADLALKYNYDINGAEILSEVESLKFQCSVIVGVQSASSILNAFHRRGLQEVYPIIGIALRLFLTLPVTVAACERSFSKLKLRNERMNELIKNSDIIHISRLGWR